MTPPEKDALPEAAMLANLHQIPPVQALPFLHDEIARSLRIIRQVVAPPDGRSRAPLSLRAGEAAKLLGRSPTWLRKVTVELKLTADEQDRYREISPSEMTLIRRSKLPPFNPTGEGRPFVLAFANQKGGVGKTTTALNFAQDMASRGFRVLVLDLDPQSSMTASFLIDRGDGELLSDAEMAFTEADTAAAVMEGESRDLRSLIRKTHWPTIDIVPSSPDLSQMVLNIAVKLMEAQTSFWPALRDATNELTTEEYDFVVIDTTPAVTLDIVQISLAADGLIIPLPMRNLDIESARAMMAVLKRWLPDLDRNLGLRLKWLRFLNTQFRAGSVGEARNETVLQRALGHMFLPHRVPRLEALERSSAGAPSIWEQPPKSPRTAAVAARDAREVVRAVNDDILALVGIE